MPYSYSQPSSSEASSIKSRDRRNDGKYVDPHMMWNRVNGHGPQICELTRRMNECVESYDELNKVVSALQITNLPPKQQQQGWYPINVHNVILVVVLAIFVMQVFYLLR
ncbi:unnamed protein product [Cochlearia groenlandica]